MSAPVTERKRAATRARTATIPSQRPAPAATPRAGTPRAATPRTREAGAAGKAYARRDDRLRRLVGGRAARAAVPPGRAQFVLLVMVLLAIGLVATLWLSTAAAADSYHLQDARTQERALQDQSERLHREVAAMDSAPELARRAAALGMVAVQDPARLVVAPDGTVSIVGEPRAAHAPPPPAPKPSAAPAAPPAAPPAAGAAVAPPAAGAQAAPDAATAAVPTAGTAAVPAGGAAAPVAPPVGAGA